MIATVVETKELLDTVLYASVSALGLTLVYSAAIWGAARFAEFSRDDRPVAAGFAAAVGLLGLAASIAAVVIGIVVMTSK
ncbi:MAG TPA: hypothetical protein VKA89_06120 [Solirubrobacterales bacterium]|nr:hypothetical protein [Solirubrobacterales bacterium]